MAFSGDPFEERETPRPEEKTHNAALCSLI
jgi:hypothetical protein